ncbi:hypothetical protein [Tunturiibacter psychrotolerans]|uniref:hypothetical protein n=1 Tax=Tunturiibacter psychrotolerans TaxID=3069686 RepID=UPI003D244077
MSHSIKSVAETVGHDVVTGVEDLTHVGTDVFKLLTTAQQLSPAFRVELSQLISDAELVASALAPDIATGGTNIPIDLASLATVLPSVRILVTHFIAFLPTLKLAISEVSSDVK